MSFKKITINYDKEKRLLINKIKKIGLSLDGIIFGGMVRDEIIATHYRQEFINKQLNFENYWNHEYHIETIGRLLIPNDIDIYFKNDAYIKFIEGIKEVAETFGGGIYVNDINHSSNFKAFNYVNSNLKLKHTKVSVEIKLGKTMRYSGVLLKLNIDIISNTINPTIDNYTYHHLIEHLEPPFFNLDFLSNIFIMEKSKGHINIRPSNCTGTPLDTMIFTEKNNFTSKVINDIINFRTQFVRNITYSYDAEYINCFRIIKMIDRDIYSWNITNVPFKPISPTDIDEKDELSCCICLEMITNKDKDLTIITTIPKVKNVLHKDCFISYLKKEQMKRFRNELNLIECRCPLRTPFNFKDCHKLVQYS